MVGIIKTNKRISTALVLLAVGFVGAPVLAQDFDKGMAAYQSGDYATALEEWRPLAEWGHAEAQINMGLIYGFGDGVPQDYAEAVIWYRLAAEQGDADAQTILGEYYVAGDGVIQDDVYAHMWFNLSASQGHEGGKYQREKLAKRMTADQIAEAQRLARECVAKDYKGC